MKYGSKNVLIAGVGGQGVLLISEVLSEACLKAGYDVKKSEVHGMAQRGGSVVSHVRYGRKIHSPLIEKGSADVLVALEELEALRWSGYLRPEGTIILNRHQIKPMPVAIGLQEYPEKIVDRLRETTGHLVALDAVSIARKTGNVRALNIAMLGALAAFLELDPAGLKRILQSKLPPNSFPSNRLAFSRGWKIMEESIKMNE